MSCYSEVDCWLPTIVHPGTASDHLRHPRSHLLEPSSLSPGCNRARLGSESITKKLPTSERVARAQEQKKRLSGVVWGPDTEPSDQLVDRFVQMAEENVVVSSA